MIGNTWDNYGTLCFKNGIPDTLSNNFNTGDPVSIIFGADNRTKESLIFTCVRDMINHGTNLGYFQDNYLLTADFPLLLVSVVLWNFEFP